MSVDFIDSACFLGEQLARARGPTTCYGQRSPVPACAGGHPGAQRSGQGALGVTPMAVLPSERTGERKPKTLLSESSRVRPLRCAHTRRLCPHLAEARTVSAPPRRLRPDGSGMVSQSVRE